MRAVAAKAARTTSWRNIAISLIDRLMHCPTLPSLLHQWRCNSAMGRVGTSVEIPSTFVPFPRFADPRTFLIEQFWGRAARASSDSNRVGAPVLFWGGFSRLVVLPRRHLAFRLVWLTRARTLTAKCQLPNAKCWFPSALQLLPLQLQAIQISQDRNRDVLRLEKLIRQVP